MFCSKKQILSEKQKFKKPSISSVNPRPLTPQPILTSKNTIKSRVSNITFKSHLSHPEIDQLLEKAKDYYKQKQWNFCFTTDIKKNNLFELFEASEILLIEGLRFHFCKKATILQKIAPINFPRLKNLNLDGNNIVSWEILGQMDLQSLQCFTLRQNYRAVGKALIKAKLPNLKFFDFPQVYEDSVDQILRRGEFTDSFSRLQITFESKSNIYPFLQSLVFKEKKWDDGQFWITVHQCGIQQNVLRGLKKVLGRRSKLFMDTRWPLCISSPEYHQ